MTNPVHRAAARRALRFACLSLAGLLACSSGIPASLDADAGNHDGGTVDAGHPDAGISDAGATDAGTPDAGTPDSGSPDSGSPDLDAGTPDAGNEVDAGSCQPAGSLGSAHGGAFAYGRHYPNGAAAVDYLYGPNGMWGSLDGLQYNDNYYGQCATADHPAGTNALVGEANGPAFTTRDANCHLLWVADPSASDPQLATSGVSGFAFREHSGVGANGVQAGGPFTLYWYDDNTLAINLSRAYGQPEASGLTPFSDFTRWSVISGDAASWHGLPYGAAGNPTSDCCIDTKALNGLYDLALGDFSSAAAEWRALVSQSGATYDGSVQRYVYPSINSNYYLGLFKTLTDNLAGDPGAASSSNPSASDLLQHSMALGANILDNQQQQGSGGAFIGWVTDIPPGGSLINTETIASQVLGLGAVSNSVFEVGVAPMRNDPNSYYLRPYHALSAVGSAGSLPGYMTTGPDFDAPAGNYAVDFRLRAPSPTGTVATVSVFDAANNEVLATHDVLASEMSTGNVWTQITLTIQVGSGCHLLELRTYWTGSGNLDVGPIRVR